MVAIVFMYTGKVEATGVEALLRTRRLASFLQIEGCVEACDLALMALANNSASLEVVQQLYACRQLLPAADDDPAAPAFVSSVQGFCRQKLVQHRGQGGGTLDSVPLADLLVWAFPSAPAVLNDAAALRSLQSLSPEALEALLANASFATDSEDSVLVMLAHWINANSGAPGAARRALVLQLRLLHLSDAFRNALLPELSWLGLTANEHRFLCTYASAAPRARSRLALTFYNVWGTSWYSADARPRVVFFEGRCLDWSISQEQLTHSTVLCAKFTECAAGHGAIVINGLEWRVQLTYMNDNSRVFFLGLCASLPQPFARLKHLEWLCSAAGMEPCRLLLRRDAVSNGRNCQNGPLTSDASVGMVPSIMAPLDPDDGQAAAPARQAALISVLPISRWTGYLRDGKISGTLTVL
ncbi:hypothetical protein GPECTOR_1g797 [Gonium pectorale]|uniref:BACK domain-containing protein n=1 Tax=Gonium pectorale TaxID=33097 RepID=A0A150H498_GONPE|nr:hypothetical protein GPECTOR_1g797 [Gonium pectorale]|eukprot:KXZ56883.1 hypothetical protein GPECTOR_1g797 [Gonium pectorale]